MAARLKDLRQKLLQGSPSNSPSRSENATLYSDCCDTKCPSPIPEKVTNSATEVVVVSDSNDDDDNPIIEISSEEEEDVTTTIMNFNKSQKVGKTKAFRRSQKERRSSSSSDDDIHVIPIKKKVTRENPKYQKPKKIQKRISSRNGGIRKRRSSENEYGAATSSSDDESVVVKQVSKPNRTKKISGGGSDASPNDSIATIGENYACSDSFGEYDGEEADIVRAGIKQYSFFSPKDCTILEQMIDDEIVAKIDTFKQCTVDRAPLRNKYFFGEGYTYGNQMRRKGPGMEELYPKGFVDGIPEWVIQFVVHPLEKAGIIPKGFINSCVINDYLTGGCITSHIDPKQLFDRPIYTISLMSDSALSFGVRFSFKPIRCSEPVYRVPLKRGCITAIRYAQHFYQRNILYQYIMALTQHIIK